jgi:hypothetical protein
MSTGLAGASDASFTGYARSLDRRDLLYVESHAISGAGTAAETRVVLYRCAVGSAPFARKELTYGADRIAPAFAFDDARSGFSEGLTRNARGLEVFNRAGPNAKRRSETIERASTLVADAGFDEFVRARWDSLERGVAVELPFLVPSRLDSVNFKVRKVSEAIIEGEDITTGFNPQFLLDGLQAIEEPVVELAFTQASKPVVMSGTSGDGVAGEGSGFRYLLMPRYRISRRSRLR